MDVHRETSLNFTHFPAPTDAIPARRDPSSAGSGRRFLAEVLPVMLANIYSIFSNGLRTSRIVSDVNLSIIERFFSVEAFQLVT